MQVGYNSLPSFSKAFSQYFGLNPAQCRKCRGRSNANNLQLKER
jgi:AraC-like DNA-binding protein